MNTKPKFWDKIFGATPGDGEMQSKEALSFSLCGFGQNLICTIIGSYITIFMTDAVGFSATSVAILMLLARLYDAGNDPIMGSIVDRTRTKWGKCRPYLKWMAFPIGAMTIICFLPWFPNSTGGFAALSIMYLLWGMIYTVADVPFWGLATAMCDDTYRRGTMLTVARLFCTAGAGIVTVVVPIITSNVTAAESSIVTAIQTLMTQLAGNDTAAFSAIVNVSQTANASTVDAVKEAIKSLTDAGINVDVSGAALYNTMESTRLHIGETLRYTYFISAIVCVVIAMPLFMIGFKNTRERNQTLTKAPSLAHNFKLLFKNTPLMLIVLSGIGGAGRMMFNYTGGLYFAKYVLADVSILGGALQGEGLYTLFTMAVVPGGLVASLLVPLCTKKFGKRNTYIYSHLAGGIAMLFAFIFGLAYDKGNYSSIATIVILVIALVIAGVPVGFSNVLTYAMIGDTVEYLELKTGERAEGICFAMQTLMNKIGMALGSFIGVLAYGIIQDRTQGVSVVNNASALTSADKDTFWYMLMLIGAISFFLSVIPLFFYKFNEKEQQEAIVILKERRAKAALEAQGAETVAVEDTAEPVNDVSEAEVVYDPDKE